MQTIWLFFLSLLLFYLLFAFDWFFFLSAFFSFHLDFVFLLFFLVYIYSVNFLKWQSYGCIFLSSFFLRKFAFHFIIIYWTIYILLTRSRRSLCRRSRWRRRRWLRYGREIVYFVCIASIAAADLRTGLMSWKIRVNFWINVENVWQYDRRDLNFPLSCKKFKSEVWCRVFTCYNVCLLSASIPHVTFNDSLRIPCNFRCSLILRQVVSKTRIHTLALAAHIHSRFVVYAFHQMVLLLNTNTNTTKIQNNKNNKSNQFKEFSLIIVRRGPKREP